MLTNMKNASLVEKAVLWNELTIDELDKGYPALLLFEHFQHPEGATLSNWHLYALVVFFGYQFLSRDETYSRDDIMKELIGMDHQIPQLIDDFIDFIDHTLAKPEDLHQAAGAWLMANYLQIPLRQVGTEFIQAGTVICAHIWQLLLALDE